MITVKFSPGQQVAVAVLSGRFDATNCAEFEQALQPLMGDHAYFIIDFTSCNYLSSAGIRTLLVSEKKLLAVGGGLFLGGLKPEIFQILEMAGLHKVFRLFANQDDARNEIERILLKASESSNWTYGVHSFHFQPVDDERKAAWVWNNEGIAGYNELNISIGTGSAAEAPDKIEPVPGFFVTCCNCAGFIPNDNDLPSDFRIPHDPSHAGIFIDQALSFGDRPTGVVRLTSPGDLSINQLADAVYPLKIKLARSHDDMMAMVFTDFNPVKPSVSLCLMVDRELGNSLKKTGFHEIPELFRSGEPGIRLWGARFVLAELQDQPAETTLDKFLKKVLTIENVINVEFIHPGDPVSNPISWIFLSDGLAKAKDKRLAIVTDGGFEFSPYQVFLTRRLYTDSSRLEIKMLHGGYSAQTFQVTSFDHQLRKLRPTVMKIADRSIINRESDRCRKYALPYILNNSAQVLGTEFSGSTGALRYNFVGIGGHDSQLKWLAHYYANWPVAKLEPLFDKIFLQILNPWYGQPIEEKIFPYRDHDPTFTFFPRLCETAEELFDISADEQWVHIEETGKKMINPYWFLKHEFPKRRTSGTDYYTSICHGDLNMQNILLDEDMNVYLIDFSETKPRSLISDFARLEAIFMVEHAVLTNISDIEEYVQFLAGFYSTVDFKNPPANNYQGTLKEQVAKNVAMTLKMREYALAGVKGATDTAPYCLALLEWVLPVVCYTAPVASKRYSMIVAGCLCEQLMQ